MMDNPLLYRLRYLYLLLMSKRKSVRNIGGIFTYRPLHLLLIIVIGALGFWRLNASEVQAFYTDRLLLGVIVYLFGRRVWKWLWPQLKSPFIKSPNLNEEPDVIRFDKLPR